MYDTRPTSGSLVHDAYSAKTHRQKNSRQQKLAAILEDAEEMAVMTEDTANSNGNGTPYFDLNHSGNVTAVLGKTALLNCRVKNIGNKTVRSVYLLVCHVPFIANGAGFLR